MRDSQRKKVYDWEDNVLLPKSKRLKEEEVCKLAHGLCKVYGMPPLAYLHTHHDDLRTAWYRRGGIILPKWAHNTCIVTHEVAHHFVYSRYSRHDVEAHGPEFVMFSITMFAEYGGLSKRKLIASAIEAGIRVE